MIRKKQLPLIPVTIIVPTRNSSTTVLLTLKSILKQKYPIREIIFIDNASLDNSVEIVKRFIKRSKIPTQIIRHNENKGVGASYNVGVKKANSSLVVLIHADSSLPTKSELEKLVSPLLKDKNIVATYSIGILPKKVWDSYNFWEKCLFARDVGKESPGFSGKFSCLRKEAFLRTGGYDELYFGKDKTMGGEDADFYLRFEKEGKIILSKAEIIHLHYLGKHYALRDWMKTRKLLARTYGRLIRAEGNKLPLASAGIGLRLRLGIFIFLVKPILAILPLVPNFHIPGILLLFAYTFLNSKSIYTNTVTLRDARILLLPFIDIFLVYFETFWMAESFFSARKRV